MNRLALFLTSTILLVVLAGTVAAQDEITLVIWGEGGLTNCIDMMADTCGAYGRTIIEGWQAAHPNIKLQLENHGWDEELRQNIVTAQLGGTAPDIITGESFMPSLVANGSLAPLDISEDVRENLVPGPLLPVTGVDGTVYGVAAFTAVFALEVNADVVRQAGLDPDTLDLSTWDKVTEVAQQISAAGNGEYYGFSLLGPTQWPVAAQFRVAPYVYQTGADFCDEGCVNPTWNDDASVKVYEWFRELYQLTPPGLAFNGDEGFVFSQLFTGLDAMQTAGAWHPAWAATSGCDDCRYFPLPVPDEGGARANVVVGNANYAVLESSEHKAEGMMFLEWLVSDEVQNDAFWSYGRLPATYSALAVLQAVADGDTASVPDYWEGEEPTAFTQRFGGYVDELLNGDVRKLPAWANNYPELNALWNTMFGEILTSDRPVKDILDDYQAQAEALATS
jgi:ABC-type glycerol-3-phosphate transport system substrate-binding protein